MRVGLGIARAKHVLHLRGRRFRNIVKHGQRSARTGQDKAVVGSEGKDDVVAVKGFVNVGFRHGNGCAVDVISCTLAEVSCLCFAVVSHVALL